MGVALLAVGGIVMLVGSVWLLVKAFQTSVLWGLGSMFVPFVSLIFVVMYWDDAKKPFLISMAGFAVYFVGIMAGGFGEEMMMSN